MTEENAWDEEEGQRLVRLIKEDNVEELSTLLSSNDRLRNNFNNSLSLECPLLHFAVQENCQKVVEYLLSQDFVDKTICDEIGENIYHVICRIRGAEQLFSIIERKVPHHLLLHNSLGEKNAFAIACKENNVFIVKRVHEILETLQLDSTPITNWNIIYALRHNHDIEVIKYILSIDGIQIQIEVELFYAIHFLTFDIVVYLLNVYLCQSIPSHLHNQFHIFQFIHHYDISKNGILQNNYIRTRMLNDNNYNTNSSYNEDYLKLVTENYQNLLEIKKKGNRIWHEVCKNGDFDVVQLIFSIKGIQPEILNGNGNNVFLLACEFNSNIKVIKYIHKLVPSFINTENGRVRNGAYLLVLNNVYLKRSDLMKTLHYLYLNGIDIHFLTTNILRGNIFHHSIYSFLEPFKTNTEDMIPYLKVISQDFDYLHNEHDHGAYRKPSFWKEFHNNNNNKVDEQSVRINEWKNRFDEHVLHHLSKMIQQHMLKPNETL